MRDAIKYLMFFALILSWPLHQSCALLQERTLKTADEYIYRAIEKEKNGNIRGAISDYTEAVKLSPNYALPYYSRGLLTARSGNAAAAIGDYDQAIRLNPRFKEAYNNRGNIKRFKGDNEGATKDFNQAIRIDPAFFEAYINLGLVKNDLKHYKGAVENFNKAIKLNPVSAIAYYNRALTFYNQGKYNEAERDCALAKVNALKSNDGRVYNACDEMLNRIHYNKLIFESFQY